MSAATLHNVSNYDKKGRNSLSIFRSWSTLVVDVISFSLVFIVSLLFVFNTFNLKPFERGFFCDDQSIMYPYKDDTVSNTQAAAIAVLVFPIVAFFVEPLYVFTCMRNNNHSNWTITKIALKSFYSLVLLYLLGGALMQSIVAMVKLSAGRLRPNFFAWCIPDYNVTNCDVRGGGHINDFVCTNTDTDAVDDAKQSFPSGHASSAVYAFTYIAIYLDIRLRQQLKWRLYFRMIAPTLQSLLVIAALYVCLSRIQDNKHHPTDVLGGAVVGLVLCLITIFVWSREAMLDITGEISEEVPAIHAESFRTSPNNVNGSQNPIMQSRYSIDNAGQDNVTFDVPSSPL
ncbi:phospholipid phosphatase 1-like [Mizuhopecten yessoensis]|uniref:Lipid phosphate phosphohydrolase 3 n=1 Tax=Mizuhopecten yessoensis TaxID=6573 RepID=A0A210Q5B4_MIZYE|nr:phospholipid phosphatase 1-like [Mizuhopecten yessoensis]OWF43879.1 Lipid phosphate phosphohydrolase 3 [Mizuhopecten yessoensis]